MKNRYSFSFFNSGPELTSAVETNQCNLPISGMAVRELETLVF